MAFKGSSGEGVWWQWQHLMVSKCCCHCVIVQKALAAGNTVVRIVVGNSCCSELVGGLVTVVILLACKQWRASNAIGGVVFAVLPMKSGNNAYQRHYCPTILLWPCCWESWPLLLLLLPHQGSSSSSSWQQKLCCFLVIVVVLIPHRCPNSSIVAQQQWTSNKQRQLQQRTKDKWMQQRLEQQGNYCRQWATNGCEDDGNNGNRLRRYLAMWSNMTIKLRRIMRKWEPFWHSNSSGWKKDPSKKGYHFLEDWWTRVINPQPTISFDDINAT